MHLLILASEFPPGPGGIGTHAYQLAHQLCRLGWEVTVIAKQDYASPVELATFNAQQAFTVLPVPNALAKPLDALNRWRIARKSIAQHRPNLILGTGDRSVWVAAAARGSTPGVAIGHGSEFGLKGWQRVVTQWAFGRMDHVICVSDFTRKYMLKEGFKPQSVSVLPNGADHTHLFPLPQETVCAFRKDRGWEQCKLLLTVGHVSERKGQRVVIEALPHILQKVPNVHYLIAGLPSLKEEFSSLASRLGVEPNVHFLGQVSQEQLRLLYNVCDVFVMTSQHTQGGDFEGYGIAAVEAALCGKPAVVSGDSGLAEAVIEGQTGLIVPQRDPRATADAIVALLSDEVMREEYGNNARIRAVTEQTWESRAKSYDLLFRQIIQS